MLVFWMQCFLTADTNAVVQSAVIAVKVIVVDGVASSSPPLCPVLSGDTPPHLISIKITTGRVYKAHPLQSESLMEPGGTWIP